MLKCNRLVSIPLQAVLSTHAVLKRASQGCRAFTVHLALPALLLVVWCTDARAAELRKEGAADSCSKLKGVMIPSNKIGLPTSGAAVVSTKLMDATKGSPGSHGEYCFVIGKVRPIDPAAPDITFHLGLPTEWNQKGLMLGGGGFDGSFAVNEVTSSLLNTPPDAPTPLGRGYAVFSSDSGHESKSLSPMTDGSFALNEEAYRNFIGDGLKKTHDAAVTLISSYYGQKPLRSYFLGASTGGREALAVAGRWPGDWDGIVSLYPARDLQALLFGLLNQQSALATPGAYPTPEQRNVLYLAALEACDVLDGVRDGVISNVAGCRSHFNPRSATLNGKSILCLPGGNSIENCLRPEQLDVLSRIDSPAVVTVALEDREQSYPGYNVFTAETGAGSKLPIEMMLSTLGLGISPPEYPSTLMSSFPNQILDNFVRYVYERDPSFNTMKIDSTHLAAIAPRLQALSHYDTLDGDLSAFAQRGGKVLLMHGTDDLLISPRSTERYVAQLQSRMGGDKVAAFLRFYEVPGLAHNTSTVFNAAWDSLTALEKWVEGGADPARNQIVTDLSGVPGRTRPLCRFPAWPRYMGTGPVNDASSFACQNESHH